LDCELSARETIGNPLARPAVAVEEITLRPAALDVGRNRLRDLPAIVADIDHVLPALPSELARADVHRWHAEIRTLADRDARVADDGGRAAEQAQEVFRKHVAEQMEVFRILFLAEDADALRRAV